MSRSIDSLSMPISQEEAYCIGGIISCSNYLKDASGHTKWLLQVIHNPKKVKKSQLTLHKRYVNKISSSLSGKLVNPRIKNYNKYIPANKDGFALVFNSSKYLNESDITTFANSIISASSKEIKSCFLAGVFDGRSSWDKHSKKIVLDCISKASADLIKAILNDIGINYDYNTARDRVSGNVPRNPQIRILSQDVPLFMKDVGLISPYRIDIISSCSVCSYISNTKSGIAGLTRIEGLRLTTRKRIYKTLSTTDIKKERYADEELFASIQSQRLKRHKSKPTYGGTPKPKSKKGKKTSTTTSVARDANVSRRALEIADFKCEYKPKHMTFIRKRDDLPYTEPHHLVPLAFDDDFTVSLDIEENIVSLCSTCHNQLHYGKDFEDILRPLYESRKKLLTQVGIFVTYDELVSMYKRMK